MMEIAIYAAVTLGGLAFIAYPLLTRRVPAPARQSPRAELHSRVLVEKEAVYSAINDLDFEYKTGKLSDDDYAELREGYRVRALNILKELDEQQPEEKGAGRGCAFCGHVNQRGSNFCESCGTELPATELVCGKCSTAYQSGDHFCSICGNPL